MRVVELEFLMLRVTVIQGRVTQKESRSSPEGIWLTKEHTDHFQRGFPPAHYKLTVKVIAIYSDQVSHPLVTL